jgi:SulP family sulfate permease
MCPVPEAQSDLQGALTRAARHPLPRLEDLPGIVDYAELPRTWRGDLMAGVTVGVVALPLALAFGVSSGVGAEAGLITAIVAGLVAGVWGGSHVQVSGPTGAMVVVLAPIVAAYGAGAVALLAILAGVLLLLMGFSRLGRAVAFLPWPVIEGFTVGIGVIIFLQQVPLALSSHIKPGQNSAVAAVQTLARTDWPAAWPAVTVVVVVAALMALLPRVNRAMPASLLAIALATLVVWWWDLAMPRIGALPSSLPAPDIPTWHVNDLPVLAGSVLAIAVLAAIESLLSARVASSMTGPDGRTTGPFNADRELVGQGLASIASGLFGGMPATGAITRTAVNVRSGGRTRAAALVHSLVLVAIVYLAAGVVGEIPLAALAGVLMVTAARMISPLAVRKVLGSTRSDAVAFLLTASITVAFDLIVAIEIGVVCAAFLTLRKLAALGAVKHEPLPGVPEEFDDRIAVFRLDGLMFFGVADRILQELAAVRGVTVVQLRLAHLQYLDATGAHALADVVSALEREGVTVLISGVRDEHMDLLSRMGVLAGLRDPRHLFDSRDAAVAHARDHARRSADSIADAATAPNPTS